MATFWDKVKFSKKPFKKGEAETVEGTEGAATKPAAKISAAKNTKTAKAAPEAKTDKKEAGKATQYSHVLVRPHMSEKAVAMAEKGTYVFEVRTDVSAPEVRNAIKAIYGILPVQVRMMNIRSREVRFGRVTGKTRSWKKALITLPTGKKLDIYG